MANKHQVTLAEYLEAKIEDMSARKFLNRGKVYSQNSILNYGKLLRFWRGFEASTLNKQITLDEISMETYYNFLMYCDRLKYKDSSKRLFVTLLKAVLNFALYEGVSSNTIAQNRNFAAVTPKHDLTPVYLDNREIEALYSLDLTGKGVVERVRDIFLLGCYTGQRVSDCLELSLSNVIYLKIKGKSYPVMRITQIKTKSEILIPIIYPQVIEILKRWGGKAPRVSISSINVNIKLLCRAIGCPNYMSVSSHTARRSCITNLYLDGRLDIMQIRTISGHKTESSFNRYICLSAEKRVESIIEALDCKASIQEQDPLSPLWEQSGSPLHDNMRGSLPL